jgi:hypothetical protein
VPSFVYGAHEFCLADRIHQALIRYGSDGRKGAAGKIAIPDASAYYAEIGSEFAWASPGYILDHLTELQALGYRQHIPRLRLNRARLAATEIVRLFAEALKTK